METVEVIIGEMISILFGAISFSFKFLNIILWAMAGALLIPTVFIAGNIYPLWEKWAENLEM